MTLVYTCEPGNAGTETANSGLAGQTDPVPTCSDGGAWVESNQLYQDAFAFQVSQLDPAILAAAFGAGLVTLGTGLLIVWAMRLILSAVRSA